MNHLARSTDISTSHEAAVHMVSSGLQAAQQDRAVSGRSACTWWPVAPGENLALGL